MSHERPFWKTGIQFECSGSGCCCRNRRGYAYVFVARAERRDIAALLQIPTRTFTRRYCERLDDDFVLRSRGKDCVFLENKRCAVYAARPLQCRTWPFWPENMTKRAWQREVVPFCPGVGHGHLYTREEIAAVLARFRERSR